MTGQRLLRLPALQERVPLAKSTIYQKMAEGSFPRPQKIGIRAIAWLESDVNKWLAEQNCGVSQ